MGLHINRENHSAFKPETGIPNSISYDNYIIPFNFGQEKGTVFFLSYKTKNKTKIGFKKSIRLKLCHKI